MVKGLRAEPGLPIWAVLLAFLFATFLAVGVAVLGDVLDNTVRHPDQVTRLMNADVIGSLPAVKEWRRRLSPLACHPNGGHVNGNGNGNGTGAKGIASNGNGLASKGLAVISDHVVRQKFRLATVLISA